jgi:predicted RNase H-like nuclease
LSDILDELAAAVTAKIGQSYGFWYVLGESKKDYEGLNIQLFFYVPEVNYPSLNSSQA